MKKRYNISQYIKAMSLEGVVNDYKYFSNKQKFNSLDEADDYTQQLIEGDVKKILNKYPTTELIMLTGDYANGSYINRTSNRRLKKSVERIKRTSEKTKREYYILPSVKSLTKLGEQIIILPQANNNMVKIKGTEDE